VIDYESVVWTLFSVKVCRWNRIGVEGGCQKVSTFSGHPLLKYTFAAETPFTDDTPPFSRHALENEVSRVHPKCVDLPSAKISEYFGSSVFNEEAMRMFLTEDAYFAVRQAIHHGAHGSTGSWPIRWPAA
jgi:hypothetical protein